MNDWWTCEGGPAAATPTQPGEPDGEAVSPSTLPRRVLLGGALAAAVAWAAQNNMPSALADVTLRPNQAEPDGDVLVTVFLRGGADGLNIVVPHGDDAYHRARPTIGLGTPKKTGSGPLDLDGFFGFHPALAPLHPLFHDDTLAAIHACGSSDETRSHFEAMATMERGQAGDKKHAGRGDASGWLARHLAGTPGGANNASPLRAIAFAATLPDALRGATQVTTLGSLADFRLQLPANASGATKPALHQALADLYQTKDARDAVAHAGRETLAVLDTLRRVDPARYRPANGAAYPTSDLGNGLKQVACLIKNGVGLEVACLDKGGWDTHVAQGGATGWQALLLADVASSLAAFARDLGTDRLKRVTLLCMTEFGRRVQENSGLGTDHGRASMMLLLGGNIVGGKVFARWPGLEKHQLDPTGDLRVTTDYRDVLAEIAARRLNNDRLSALFPGYAPRFVGVARPALLDHTPGRAGTKGA